MPARHTWSFCQLGPGCPATTAVATWQKAVLETRAIIESGSYRRKGWFLSAKRPAWHRLLRRDVIRTDWMVVAVAFSAAVIGGCQNRQQQNGENVMLENGMDTTQENGEVFELQFPFLTLAALSIY